MGLLIVRLTVSDKGGKLGGCLYTMCMVNTLQQADIGNRQPNRHFISFSISNKKIDMHNKQKGRIKMTYITIEIQNQDHIYNNKKAESRSHI